MSFRGKILIGLAAVAAILGGVVCLICYGFQQEVEEDPQEPKSIIHPSSGEWVDPR